MANRELTNRGIRKVWVVTQKWVAGIDLLGPLGEYMGSFSYVGVLAYGTP